MTEKKPGEPDERDIEVWQSCCDMKPGREYTIAAYREEIESRVKHEAREMLGFGGAADLRKCSTCKKPYPDYGVSSQMQCWDCRRKIAEVRARRAGAREALERAGYQDLGNGPQCRVCWQKPTDKQPHVTTCWLDHAIRALADQPEAEGKQAPGVADLALMRGEATAKADALPLGHRFLFPETGHEECGPCKDRCHALILPDGVYQYRVCNQPEAAHGRK